MNNGVAGIQNEVQWLELKKNLYRQQSNNLAMVQGPKEVTKPLFFFPEVASSNTYPCPKLTS